MTYQLVANRIEFKLIYIMYQFIGARYIEKRSSQFVAQHAGRDGKHAKMVLTKFNAPLPTKSNKTAPFVALLLCSL